MILFRDAEQYKVAQGIVDRMVRRALELDGTCTGEHGVGLGKRKYLYEELGESTVEFMKTIKRTIDPLNLFNPGKVSSCSLFRSAGRGNDDADAENAAVPRSPGGAGEA